MTQNKKIDCSDERYHNTLLLFQRYRNILWSVKLETAKAERSFLSEYGKSIEQFLDDIYNAGADLNGTEIEERARSISRSYQMLKLLDDAVELMRSSCEDGELMFHILRFSYMEPKKHSYDEIFSGLQSLGYFVSERTFLRKRREAVDVVSSILWGYTSRDCLEILNHFVE